MLGSARGNEAEPALGDELVVHDPEDTAGYRADEGVAEEVSHSGADRGIETAEKPKFGVDLDEEEPSEALRPDGESHKSGPELIEELGRHARDGINDARHQLHDQARQNPPVDVERRITPQPLAGGVD